MHALPLLALCALGASPQFEGEVLDFSATWCGPCQRMNPIVHRLEREGLPIRQVDVDRDKSLARQYGVTNIPAFVLVVNGKAVDRVVGVTTESRLRSMIARIPKKSPAVADNRSRTRAPSSSRSSTRAAGPAGIDLGLPASFPGATVRANIDQDEDDGFGDDGFGGDGLGDDEFGAPGFTADFEEPKPPAIELEPAPAPAPARTAGPRPHEATVRIRVTDGDGINFGSGTIVETKRGRALILSCGHVFRDLKQGSTIEVDVFDWDGDRIAARETYVGDVIGYDLDSDVGLLSIPCQKRLPVCPIAGTDHLPAVGNQALNVGCSRGELPTIEQVRVKQLNRYLGPDNLQCTGVPVQGRSGGGLFDAAGRVIGVCIARDPRDQEGIYAGPKAIHALLDQQEFAYLHRSERTAPPTRQPEPAPIVFASSTTAEPRATPERTRPRQPEVSLGAERAFAENVDPVERQLAVEAPELVEAVGDAEVICIIRKHGQPESESRVVVINRASGRFVDYLAGELKTQPRLTSEHVGNRRANHAGDEAERRLGADGWRVERTSGRPCPTAGDSRRPTRGR